MLQSVLAVGNTDQNQTYPPFIYQTQYNIVAGLLLSKLAEQYPASLDMLLPFIEDKKIAVTNGYIELPDNYRNMLGNPSINIKPEGSDCDGIPITANAFKTANLKAACQSRPIDILDQTEWDYRTTSTYAYPTYFNPIGCFFGKKLKVCPYDIAKVDVRYVRQEKEYVFGYLEQPDGTYIYDKNTSIESEFESAAFEPMFKAISSLYAAYTRDQLISNWAVILHEKGIL
jgi:hypothetical protein